MLVKVHFQIRWRFIRTVGSRRGFDRMSLRRHWGTDMLNESRVVQLVERYSSSGSRTWWLRRSRLCKVEVTRKLPVIEIFFGMMRTAAPACASHFSLYSQSRFPIHSLKASRTLLLIFSSLSCSFYIRHGRRLFQTACEHKTTALSNRHLHLVCAQRVA